MCLPLPTGIHNSHRYSLILKSCSSTYAPVYTHANRATKMNVLHHAEEEPNSFAAHRQLRVAVVPLGGVPGARFRVYLSLLRRSFHELPMANLSKPGSWKKESSPFKHFSWFDGNLLLQYLDRAPPSTSASSEWQDFQAFRRTWAVSPQRLFLVKYLFIQALASDAYHFARFIASHCPGRTSGAALPLCSSPAGSAFRYQMPVCWSGCTLDFIHS